MSPSVALGAATFRQGALPARVRRFKGLLNALGSGCLGLLHFARMDHGAMEHDAMEQH